MLACLLVAGPLVGVQLAPSADRDSPEEDPGPGPEEGSAAGPGLPAVVDDADARVSQESYPVHDGAGNKLGEATWRVVEGTGNCCENFLASSPSGRLYDFGGTYLHFSDDQGETWKRLRPPVPVVGGEGAVTVAPDGDVLGVGWDVYSGDRIWTARYDAQSETWSTADQQLKTPFFDRPWLAAVPGPVETAEGVVPYAAVLIGAWPSKAVGYVSPDGLHYGAPTALTVDDPLASDETAWLDEPAEASADATQPLTNARVAPLPGGGAIASRDDLVQDFRCDRRKLTTRLTWNCFDTPGGLPDGRLLVDSLGRIHVVDIGHVEVTWRTSDDGGRTWQTASVDLAAYDRAEEVDVKAHAAAGIGAVAIHAHDRGAGADQDLVVRFDIDGAPALEKVYRVGDGDLDAGSGFGSSNRYDFATLTILPDGTIATSFADRSHHPPSVAVLVADNT